jgi:hypothetical protein
MKLEKAERREKANRRKKYGMRISGKRRLQLILEAIKKRSQP